MKKKSLAKSLLQISRIHKLAGSISVGSENDIGRRILRAIHIEKEYLHKKFRVLTYIVSYKEHDLFLDEKTGRPFYVNFDSGRRVYVRNNVQVRYLDDDYTCPLTNYVPNYPDSMQYLD